MESESPKEVYRTQIDADGFLLDIIVLSNGQKVVPKEDMLRLLSALSKGELSDAQVAKIKKITELLVF
jgi:hypothetical protein